MRTEPDIEGRVTEQRTPPPRPGIGPWLRAALAVALGLLLCSSWFAFGGAKVDESEIVLNALTIATGEWHPVWSPGYGHLAMYIPAGALAIVALLLQASGVVGSYAGGLDLLFANGGAYRVVRLLYCIADVSTALLWARIVFLVGRERLLAIACAAYFVFSPDTWLYANYVRSDTLVSLFVACAVYLLVGQRTRRTPVLLGIALGAAIACKYSAAAYLALIGFLLVPPPEGDSGIRHRIAMAATALGVALVSTFLFQPKFDYSGIIAAIGVHLSGTHFVHETVPLGERLVRLWHLVRALEPLAAVFSLLALAGFARPRSALPVLAAAAIGIAPFAISQFPRDYWLIPFADALRAAGWVGIACAIGSRAPWRDTARRWTGALAILLVMGIALERLPQLARSHRAPATLSNVEAARRWLYVHAANRKPLDYGYEKNFLLPRAYSFASYDDAAALSRVFIFHREEFRPLHAMFHRQLYQREFAEFSSITRVPPLVLGVARSAVQGRAPQLCAGGRCYPPKPTACPARMRSAQGNCVAYGWDMDRSVLRTDLAKLALVLPPGLSSATACWYTCDTGAALQPLRLPASGGKVALVDVAGSLFAPARVRSLTQIRGDRACAQDSLIVTTPRAYEAWLPKVRRKGEGASAAFARLMNARLVRYFDTGGGPAIEIYARKVGQSRHPGATTPGPCGVGP